MTAVAIAAGIRAAALAGASRHVPATAVPPTAMAFRSPSALLARGLRSIERERGRSRKACSPRNLGRSSRLKRCSGSSPFSIISRYWARLSLRMPKSLLLGAGSTPPRLIMRRKSVHVPLVCSSRDLMSPTSRSRRSVSPAPGLSPAGASGASRSKWWSKRCTRHSPPAPSAEDAGATAALSSPAALATAPASPAAASGGANSVQ
mmetsp:Transcript_45319/g.94944  ORF Transcript_45319/g.94944 Transcript_45319/m.94944 type:complete len:205 (-) Transcript_45319:22-636(-)